MRNLLILLWKYHFLLLFILLETFAGYLLVRNNNFQKASFVNSANSVAAGVLNFVSGIKDYIHLKYKNESLATENARLYSMLPDAFYGDTIGTVKLEKNVSRQQQYKYISAKVINNSTNKRNNYLTLNRGAVDGIKPEMGVISGNGLVGIVKDVSEHYCTVISLLHKDFHTSAKLSRSNYFGNLEWTGGDPTKANITDMPKHVKLAVGDTLLTSTYSAVFPEGVAIGTIYNFELKPGDNFYTITVNLSTDFQKIDYVYVVNNLLKEEQKKLEGNFKND